MAKEAGGKRRQGQLAKPTGKGFEGWMPSFMNGPERTIVHRAAEAPEPLNNKAMSVKKKPRTRRVARIPRA